MCVMPLITRDIKVFHITLQRKINDYDQDQGKPRLCPEDNTKTMVDTQKHNTTQEK